MEALKLDWNKFVSCSTLDVNFSNTQNSFFFLHEMWIMLALLGDLNEANMQKHVSPCFIYLMLLLLFSHYVMSDSLWIHGLGSLPGSSVHGIFWARILECVAIPFSRGSSQPRIEPASPARAGGFFTTEPFGKPYFIEKPYSILAVLNFV